MTKPKRQSLLAWLLLLVALAAVELSSTRARRAEDAESRSRTDRSSPPAAAGSSRAAVTSSAADDVGVPGSRVLLDAHNCYPYSGRWTDRLDRALASGMPLAIEQDLVWYTDSQTGAPRSVVAHGLEEAATAPSVREHFFERVRPFVERA
ncbi:MAG: hypothetical protein ACRD2X_19730, partial [Vicinamibacteraceae bacterium]